MSTYILYIGIEEKRKGNKILRNPPVQDVIDEVIKRHQTLQDAVVIKRTSEVLPGGFEIVKEDDTLANVLKRGDKLKLTDVKDRARHIKYEKDGAKYSGDQTFKGVKPYRNQ